MNNTLFHHFNSVIFPLHFVIFSRPGYADSRDLTYDRSGILSIVLLKEAELAVLLSGGDAFIFSH
jgi:hypothetical protein